MLSAKEARETPLESVFEYLGMVVKADRHFQPKRDPGTKRLHITDNESNYVHEIVLTGMRWYDLRQHKGGGGAIDLVMHLRGCDFHQAMMLLQRGEKNLGDRGNV